MTDESSCCPTCGVFIADLARLLLHLDGLDASRLECARQNIEAIKARETHEEIERGIARAPW